MIFARKDVGKYINWKQVAIFIALVCVFYLPVFLSDVINNGDNLKQFISSVSKKSSHGSFLNNAAKEAYYFGKNFTYLLSSYTGNNKAITSLSQLFIFMSFIANILLLKKEKNSGKKNFLLLILIFFSVFYFIYFFLSKEIDKSRFFLPLAHIPFIYLGLLIFYFMEYSGLNKTSIKILGSLALLGSIGWNIHMDIEWFRAMQISQQHSLSQKDSFALQTKNDSFWWSWSHFEKIAAYMKNDCEKQDIFFLSSKSARDYSPSIKLAFSYMPSGKNMRYIAHDVPKADACFYFVSQMKKDISSSIGKNFIQNSNVDLGNVNITRFSFSENQNTASAINTTIDISDDDTNIAPKTTSVLNMKKPRQFWTDVWDYFFAK
jgi:hypothetical protein